MKGYQSYHSNLKAMYYLGLYVPKEISRLVPTSNISRWKSQSPTSFVGHEWLQTIEKHKDQLNLVLENQQTKRSIRVLLKVNLFLINQFFQSGHFYKVMKSNMESVVDFVGYLSEYLTIEKATKLIGLSRITYQSYLHQLKYKCFNSPIMFCYKANPLQLSFNEIQKIKTHMISDCFKYWPAISIYYYWVRNGEFLFSKSTFYKYTALLGLTKRWVRKKRKREGLRATRPNEYWHADVSIWDNQGIRYYIYIVIDNYSRKILSWKVTQKISAKLMFENLSSAYQNYTPSENVKLVVDGGSENEINRLIHSNQYPIKKIRAKVDIEFTNNMVEATFQTIKKYYFRTLSKTQNIINPTKQPPWIIKDINSIKPNAQLNGLTPDEAYRLKFGAIPKMDKVKARQLRRIENLNYCCKLNN